MVKSAALLALTVIDRDMKIVVETDDIARSVTIILTTIRVF
jgi:phage baseplate assembly protein W